MDFSLLVAFLMIFFGIVAFVSGAIVLVRSFFNARVQINRSMSMDLEIIRVSKSAKPKETMEKRQDYWKEEIGAMEKLLSDALGMRVDIRHDSGRGEVRVTYQSLDQLDALCRLLSS